MPVRRAEASAVRRIIQDKWGNHAQRDWLVVGDLNDYRADSNGNVIPSGLDPLFEGGFAVNLVENLPLAQRWTHHYAPESSHRQIDYILASPALAAKNPNVQPEIIRNGQPYRVPNVEAERYPRVGFDRPKASDHCAVAVTLNV